ncbi:MAG: Gfo/Idh/MocA family oxidoreductase [Eubacteriales bacterium]|nr:Gfo/Idh/MocA family oxidoreductase [Eubacteriales bacterium]
MNQPLRAAIVGLGPRGSGLLPTFSMVKEISITAICDFDEELLQKGAALLAERGIHPKLYLDYHELIAQGNIDLVYVITNWNSHIPVAIDFLRAAIPTATEVCGAASVEACWELVHEQERTGTPFMFLENCCYGRNEMAVLRMVREGVMGHVVYAECGYCHDLRSALSNPARRRVKNNLRRNGDLYPTHGIGPVAKILNINRGNRLLTISSMGSAALGMKEYFERNDPENPLRKENYACADVTSSLIKCANGELIMMRHNVFLPRPYSRALTIQGTLGLFSEEKDAIHIDGLHEHEEWEKMDSALKRYEHPIWQNYSASEADGHGGMDWLVMQAFAVAVRDHAPMPIDVYDAATWMSLTALSEQSTALGGMPQIIPDFTSGRWTERLPEDLF